MKYLATFAVLIGFVCVLVAADYYDQVKNDPEVTDIASYRASIDKRTAWLSAIAGETSPGVSGVDHPVAHLPEAPDGWQMRAWEKGDIARLPGIAGREEERLGIGQMTGLSAITSGSHETFVQKLRAPTSRVYIQDDHFVHMAAIKRAPVSAFATENAMADLVTTSAGIVRPYGVIQGVLWQSREVPKSEYVNGAAPLALEAEIGDVTLYARSAQNDLDIDAFLNGVDYDAINATLDEPLPRIGTNAVAMTAEEEKRFIKDTRAAQRAARDARQAQAEQDYMKGQSNFYNFAKGLGGTQQMTSALEAQFEQMGLPDRVAAGDTRVMRPAEIIRRQKELDDDQNRTFGMYGAHLVLSIGTDWDGMRIAVDGNYDAAPSETVQFKNGSLADDHPTKALRAAEIDRGLEPGACLQIVHGSIICGTQAERLRFLWAGSKYGLADPDQLATGGALARENKASPSAAAPVSVAAPAPAKATTSQATTAPKEIRVNRLPTAGKGSNRSAGCGGTAFCKVSSD